MLYRFLVCFILLFYALHAGAQTTNKIQADTVKIYQVGKSAELVIENSTRGLAGSFLQNIGNGRTGFAYVLDTAWMENGLLKIRRGSSVLSINVSVLDADNNGIPDDADKFGGHAPSGWHLQRVTDNGATTTNTITAGGYVLNYQGTNIFTAGANIGMQYGGYMQIKAPNAAYNATIVTSNLSSHVLQFLPNKSGTFAMLSDLTDFATTSNVNASFFNSISQISDTVVRWLRPNGTYKDVTFTGFGNFHVGMYKINDSTVGFVSLGGGVDSLVIPRGFRFNGTGLVRMNGTNVSYDNTAYAPIHGPIFTGSPQVATEPFGSASNNIANTNFVAQAVGPSFYDAWMSGDSLVLKKNTNNLHKVKLPFALISGASFTGNISAPNLTFGNRIYFSSGEYMTWNGAWQFFRNDGTSAPLSFGQLTVGTTLTDIANTPVNGANIQGLIRGQLGLYLKDNVTAPIIPTGHIGMYAQSNVMRFTHGLYSPSDIQTGSRFFGPRAVFQSTNPSLSLEGDALSYYPQINFKAGAYGQNAISSISGYQGFTFSSFDGFAFRAQYAEGASDPERRDVIFHGNGDVYIANLNDSSNVARMVTVLNGKLRYQNIPSGNSGSVTSISVVSANGFAGFVANASSTPAITLSTTITGLLKGNGTAISAAAAGSDYVAPNAAITGATKTKITYDSKGLVTAGADATTSDIAEGSNQYFTAARVRSTTLTGYAVGSNAALAATDDFLTALGKVQGQINALTSGSGGIGDPGANGILARTALNTTAARTFAGTTNRIVISNADGVSGNPTFDIGSDVATLSGAQTFTAANIFSGNLTASGGKIRIGTITGSHSSNSQIEINQSVVIQDASGAAARLRFATDGTSFFMENGGTSRFNGALAVGRTNFSTTNGTAIAVAIHGASGQTANLFQVDPQNTNLVGNAFLIDANSKLYAKNTLGAAGTRLMTAVGANGEFSYIPNGTDGQILGMVAGAPAFMAAPPMPYTQYNSGTSHTLSGVGFHHIQSTLTSANGTITFPSPTGLAGHVIVVRTGGQSGGSWVYNVSGSVFNGGGTNMTTLQPYTTYSFICTGSYWNLTSIQGL